MMMSQAMMADIQKFPHKIFPNFQSTILRYSTCKQLRVDSYPMRVKREKMLTITRPRAARDPPPPSGSAVWANDFLSYTSEITEITSQEKHEHEDIKEKVRKMLVETPENSTQKLLLIDTIQRLGVAYHFLNEIETSLQNIFHVSPLQGFDDDNLYLVALRFRLLRQQGHFMSSDVFKLFTNLDGKFKETLYDNVEGLLSLYEASHMRVHGEDILEEALCFTTTHLESMVVDSNLSNSLKVQVTEALSQPIRKTMARLGAVIYISIYENMEGRNHLLLKFAKLDFNMLQKVQQGELHDFTRWCNDMDFVNKYPDVRDAVLCCYFWTTGLEFELQDTHARMLQVKLGAFNGIVDDLYDSLLPFDELVLFNNAIERMDIGAMDSLPPYMRPIYKCLLDIYNDMEQVLTKEGKSAESLYYAKKEMKRLVSAYLKEAEWVNTGYTPKCDEFLKIGILTSTNTMFLTHRVVMKGFLTKEVLEWLKNEPLIIQAASITLRLYDDINDYEVDKQRGYNISFIHCYMKEFGVSKEVACVETRKILANAWKDISKELLHPLEVPMTVLELALHSAQTINAYCKDGRGADTVINSKFKDTLRLLYVQRV